MSPTARPRATDGLLGRESARLRLVYFLYYSAAGTMLPFLAR